MMYGYAGYVLKVDLTKGKVIKEELKRELIQKFLGGRGFGAKTLFDELAPGVDPLSPQNIIIFAVGPFTGTLVPKGCKYSVISKSPMTNCYGDSEGGGFFGPELKYAGFDMIVIYGASEKPVYLWINDGRAEIRDASNLWGKSTFETTELIQEELGDKSIKVACIGPAGENLVRYACICNDLYRQAGRTGMGAVMGSKKLKAVAVRGTGEIKIAKPDEFLELAKEALKKTLEMPATKMLREQGTLLQIMASNEWGVLPTRNFQDGVFELAERLSAQYAIEHLFVKARACFGCPVACGHVRYVKSGKYKGALNEGPEYELTAMLGSNCGIGSLECVTKAAQLCDELGLDGISTGNVIGFAMECYERGILTDKDTGGLKLNFGNEEALLEVIRKIASREGIGDLLAEGVKRAAEKLGKGAEDIAVHVKGLELPAYDARGSMGTALGFAIADIGGSHCRSWTMGPEISKGIRFEVAGKAEMVRDSIRARTLPDILGFCRFCLLDFDTYAKLLTAITGIEYKASDLIEVTDRVYTLTRAFNVREGITRQQDTLPKRVLTEPLKQGPTKGVYVKREDLDKMISEFYKLYGWDENGIPREETLRKLGLEDVLESLRNIGKISS